MKKLLLTLSSISLTVMPSLNIISCQTKNDDEDYFIPTEQPKSIQEIEESVKKAVSKSDNFKVNFEKEWSEYKIKIDYENMTDEEQEKEWMNYNLNSINTQKDSIFRFWKLVYAYKVFQFNENYSEELEIDNGTKIIFSAVSKEDFIWLSGDVFLNDKYSNKKTKDHLKKMYDWAIQDNPNVSY